MKIAIRVALFLFAVWLINHPNTKAFIKGVSSVAVEDPIDKAKADFRAEAKKQAQAREEARAREIDAALEKMENRNPN